MNRAHRAARKVQGPLETINFKGEECHFLLENPEAYMEFNWLTYEYLQQNTAMPGVAYYDPFGMVSDQQNATVDGTHVTWYVDSAKMQSIMNLLKFQVE